MKITSVKNLLLAAFAAVGSAIVEQLGGWDTALKALMCAMAADYLTGVLVACVWHKSSKTEGGGLSSAVGFKGLAKKGSILAFVWFGVNLDNLIGGTWVRSLIILFFTANEGLSILENMGAMGIEYPKPVKEALEALRNEAEQTGKHLK